MTISDIINIYRCPNTWGQRDGHANTGPDVQHGYRVPTWSPHKSNTNSSIQHKVSMWQ